MWVEPGTPRAPGDPPAPQENRHVRAVLCFLNAPWSRGTILSCKGQPRTSLPRKPHSWKEGEVLTPVGSNPGDREKGLKAILSHRVPTAPKGRRESQHLTSCQRAW